MRLVILVIIFVAVQAETKYDESTPAPCYACTLTPGYRQNHGSEVGLCNQKLVCYLATNQPSLQLPDSNGSIGQSKKLRSVDGTLFSQVLLGRLIHGETRFPPMITKYNWVPFGTRLIDDLTYYPKFC